MGKTLIIAEKPSVAADIAKALGGFRRVDDWLESDNAVISNAIGHLVEIFSEEAETSGKDFSTLPVIPERFSLRPIERTKRQFFVVRNLMRRDDIDAVVNACDAGREGELIFRLTYELAGCKKPMSRMWLQSMTPDSIRDAYSTMKPGSFYDNLADAAKCRGEADWLIGINGSRGASKLRERQTGAYEMTSAGRVQTPTLAILVDRENAIAAHVPQDYWEIFGDFGVAAGVYSAKWFNPANKEQAAEGKEPAEDPNRFFDKAAAEAIVAKCRGVTPSSVTDESKPIIKHPPKLFDLTTLQREANKKFKFTAAKTLQIAQDLYEKHKVTTYPRTDSTALPEDYVGTATKTMQTFSGTAYGALAEQVLNAGWIKPTKRIFDNSKISDHFAIIPNGHRPGALSAEEQKVYDMIVRRFVAVFFPAAEYQQTVRITIVSGESFKASGKVLAKKGWLEVYGAVDDEEDKKTPALCLYSPGEAVTNKKVDIKQSRTKPPVRYTEANLLAAMASAGKLVDDEELAEAMSERGLGTPATRANIIEGLVSRGTKERPKEPYAVRLESGVFQPTKKGIGLIAFFRSNGIEILTSPALTGEWEHKLHQMEKGQVSRVAFMGEIADLTRRVLDTIKATAAATPLQPKAVVSEACPSCGGQVVESGRFFECLSSCGFRLWREVAGRKLTSVEVATLIAEGEVGPLTGFMGKNNKPFSASLKFGEGYKVEFSLAPPVTTDPNGKPVACPRCSGGMRRVNGKKGFFWSCLDRDGCNTLIDDEKGFPVNNFSDADGNAVKCPSCKSAMRRIKGKKGFFWGCTNRDSCKETMNDRNGHPVPKDAESEVKATCEQCGKSMRRVEWKGSAFWSCIGYKEGCKFRMDDKDGMPVQKKAATERAEALL